jgi:hypothetical protein
MSILQVSDVYHEKKSLKKYQWIFRHGLRLGHPQNNGPLASGLRCPLFWECPSPGQLPYT